MQESLPSQSTRTEGVRASEFNVFQAKVMKVWIKNQAQSSRTDEENKRSALAEWTEGKIGARFRGFVEHMDEDYSRLTPEEVFASFITTIDHDLRKAA